MSGFESISAVYFPAIMGSSFLRTLSRATDLLTVCRIWLGTSNSLVSWFFTLVDDFIYGFEYYAFLFSALSFAHPSFSLLLPPIVSSDSNLEKVVFLLISAIEAFLLLFSMTGSPRVFRKSNA